MDNSVAGRHLIFTGFARPDSRDVLDDPEALAEILHEVIALVGMQVLVPARMVRVELDPSKAEGPEDCGGVTGTAVLSTSHVSVHTWPLHDRVSFDLYSCHEFDSTRVLELLVDRLGLTGGDILSLARVSRPELRGSFRYSRSE